jgi:Helix-turn-helix domain
MRTQKNITAVDAEGGELLLDQLLTVGEAAAVLRCSVASLNRWRLTGEGPRFIYVGRRVRYARAALADFIAASTRRSTSDAGQPAAATAA